MWLWIMRQHPPLVSPCVCLDRFSFSGSHFRKESMVSLCCECSESNGRNIQITWTLFVLSSVERARKIVTRWTNVLREARILQMITWFKLVNILSKRNRKMSTYLQMRKKTIGRYYLAMAPKSVFLANKKVSDKWIWTPCSNSVRTVKLGARPTYMFNPSRE